MSTLPTLIGQQLVDVRRERRLLDLRLRFLLFVLVCQTELREQVCSMNVIGLFASANESLTDELRDEVLFRYQLLLPVFAAFRDGPKAVGVVAFETDQTPLQHVRPPLQDLLVDVGVGSVRVRDIFVRFELLGFDEEARTVLNDQKA